jgi:hypothetical protein
MPSRAMVWKDGRAQGPYGMPIPQIAVEIAAPARAEAASGKTKVEAQRTLLAACTAAAATGGDCVLSRSDLEPTVLALVFWRSPGHVRVEVGLAARTGPWAIRDLEFSSSDPAVEKWRTVGYAVGALASEALTATEKKSVDGVPGSAPAPSPPGSQERDTSAGSTDPDGAARVEKPATESKAAQRAAPEPAPNRNEPEVAAARLDDRQTPDATASTLRDTDASAARWGLGVSGLVGPGLASVRGGGAVRVSRRFQGPFATGALAYSVDGENGRGISANRIALSAGGGYELRLGGSYGVCFRLEIVAEQLVANVDDPASGRTDSRGRWVAAAAIGAEAVRALAGPVGVVLGVEGTVRTNRTDVQVGNSERTTIPMADFLALAGVRVLLL